VVKQKTLLQAPVPPNGGKLQAIIGQTIKRKSL